MRARLVFAAGVDAGLRRALGYNSARDAILDPRGWSVRCTPRRRTVMGPEVGAVTVFRKWRVGRGGAREWTRLRWLAELGFCVPAPVCFAEALGQSVLVLQQVPGRPLDVLLAESCATPARRAGAARYCAEVVAPMVRRMHDLGVFYRDLYWNHLFAEAAEPGAPEPYLIDVERAFRPRLLRRKWRVKDLAGLLSSTPPRFPRSASVRFLRRYVAESGRVDRRLAAGVVAKAERIRAHVPKYG